MNDDIRYLIFVILGLIMTLISINTIFLYKRDFKKIEKMNNNMTHTNKKDSFNSDPKPLYIYRNLTFPDNIHFNRCEISTSMQEIFNIFLKIAPSMASILMKVDKRIYHIKTVFDNPATTKEDIKKEIGQIDDLLSQFINVSHQLVERYRDITPEKESIEDVAYEEINPQAVREYMTLVNFMVNTAENHSIINYEIHMKLKEMYPELIEPFRVIISKTIYLLFIGAITFAIAFDNSILLYDKSDK